jgi:hypothetical protein
MAFFTGFTYAGKHTSAFSIFRVSGNPFYNEPMFGEISDNIKTIVGKDGAYYTNSTYGAKSFSLDLAFSGMTESQYMSFKAWLKPSNTFGTLIFDETPFREQYVKLASNSAISYVPSGYTETVNFVTTNVNNYLYNGTVTITFLQVDPYSYSTVQSVADFSALGDNQHIWENNSNILLTSQTPSVSLSSITTATHAWVLNAGNATVFPTITVTGSGTNICIARRTAPATYQGVTIDSMSSETIRIENQNGQLVKTGSPDTLVTFRRVAGSYWVSLLPTVTISRYATATYNVGVASAKELILPAGSVWPTDCVGRCVYVNSAWFEIATRESDVKVTLVSSTNLVDDTQYSSIICALLNDIYITGTNFNVNISFTFKHKYI